MPNLQRRWVDVERRFLAVRTVCKRQRARAPDLDASGALLAALRCGDGSVGDDLALEVHGVEHLTAVVTSAGLLAPRISILIRSCRMRSWTTIGKGKGFRIVRSSPASNM